MILARIKLAIAVASVAALAACATKPVSAPVASSSKSEVQAVFDDLAQTAAGKNVIKWVEGDLKSVASDVENYNASLPGGGLTVAKIKKLCGMDNSLHTLLGMVLPFVPSPGFNVDTVDKGLYAGIQDACALATGGTIPTVADVTNLVSEFKNATKALGLK